MFMEPRNWFQGINSASLCSLVGRYDNPIPPRFLAHIDFLKIPALAPNWEMFKEQESIPPAYVACMAWRADTSNRIVILVRQAGNQSIHGLLKRFTNSGSDISSKIFHISMQGLQGDVVYLSWPIAPLVVRAQMRGGGGGVAGSQPMRIAVHITWHGSQINFGDLTPYLTYYVSMRVLWRRLSLQAFTCRRLRSRRRARPPLRSPPTPPTWASGPASSARSP